MKSIRIFAWLVLLFPAPVFAEVVTGRDVQTGLSSWEWREAGISIQLVQRLPDQTRAFFEARGFSAKAADRIARACVFQTIFRNDGNQPLSYDLENWRIRHQGKSLSLRTRERWDELWEQGGANQAARIALRWSLLPSQQHFESGDYNWGMTSFGLPPGQIFDLSIAVTRNETSLTRKIPGIICAADREDG